MREKRGGYDRFRRPVDRSAPLHERFYWSRAEPETHQEGQAARISGQPCESPFEDRHLDAAWVAGWHAAAE